jgi:hypothetical protein
VEILGKREIQNAKRRDALPTAAKGRNLCVSEKEDERENYPVLISLPYRVIGNIIIRFNKLF